MEAIKTVDPKVAIGRPSGLWLSLARHYEKLEDLENARVVMQKACDVNYKTVDELANVSNKTQYLVLLLVRCDADFDCSV